MVHDGFAGDLRSKLKQGPAAAGMDVSPACSVR